MKKTLITKMKEERIQCPFFEDCKVALTTEKSCLKYENCQTYKFKAKYGESYDYLGVGS